jgi:hypothetical protein
LKQALIIFVRNPELGKVKTRLAKTIGNEKALRVYLRLLAHTHSITKELSCDKFIFYADNIHIADIWETKRYIKRTQKGNDLGERMRDAFIRVFAEGYTNIQIIGSDCYELSPELILTGFEKSEENDIVIGPTVDGGYYLLGMKAPFKDLFSNKQWSTDSVFTDTMEDIRTSSFSFYTLPVLRDVDEEKDIPFAYS